MRTTAFARRVSRISCRFCAFIRIDVSDVGSLGTTPEASDGLYGNLASPNCAIAAGGLSAASSTAICSHVPTVRNVTAEGFGAVATRVVFAAA